MLTTVVEIRASLRLQGLQVRLQEQEITFPLGRFSVPAGSRVAQNRLGAAAPLSRWRPLRFRAALVVRGKLPPGALKDAQVTLDLISASEAVTPLSLRVRRRKRQIRVRSTFSLSEILAGRPSGRPGAHPAAAHGRTQRELADHRPVAVRGRAQREHPVPCPAR